MPWCTHPGGAPGSRSENIAVHCRRSYTICMNTATDLPGFLREPAVTPSPQRDLFGDVDAPATPSYGLYAEVVFDRPLDHAYSYAVPEGLRNSIAIGKRVQ